MITDATRRRFLSSAPSLLINSTNIFSGSLAGESYTRNTTANEWDVNGILQSRAINTMRKANYIGGIPTILMETSRTNSCLWSRDLTNAVWVKTGTGTVTLTATGLDGTANSASILTDSDAAAGYKVEQSWAIANDNAFHCVSVYFRKDAVSNRFPRIALQLTGGVTPVRRDCQINTQTGAISAAMNNAGSGTHRIVDENLWWAVEIVLTNNTTGNVTLLLSILPADGSVLGVTDVTVQGSATVGQVQTELINGVYSSPIFTTAAAVGRGIDIYSIPWPYPPFAFSAYYKGIERGTTKIASARIFQISDSTNNNPKAVLYAPAGNYSAFHNNGAITAAVGPAGPPNLSDPFEALYHLYNDGSVDYEHSINGAASVFGARTTAAALAANWSNAGGTLLYICSGAVSAAGINAMVSLKLVADIRAMAEMRAA